MTSLAEFFSQPLFVIMGGMASLIVIISFVYGVYLWVSGAGPVLYRLGMGLSKRKIAIFAEAEFDDLKGLLVDSNIFDEKNIIKIGKNALKKSENIDLLLVHYKFLEDEMYEILNLKKDSDALVVYAPLREGAITDELRDKINSERNTTVVNFRGRLLNDILAFMMTTAYRKK